MRKSKLDIGELEKQIRRQFPQVTWTSGRLMGTRLLLELKENDAPIPEDTQGADAIIGRDLVAEYDGVITDMIVRSGIPQVTIGSQVAKGDLLVDGKVPIYAEDGTIREYRMVIADADIRMEHSGHFRIFLPADYILKKYTGREKTGYFMRLGDREWKQARKVSFLQYDSILNTHSMKILKMFGINGTFGKITYREYQKTEYLRNDSEAKEILQEKISDFLESLGEKGVQIISKDVKIETKCDGWVAHGELVVQEKVGTQVDTTQKED